MKYSNWFSIVYKLLAISSMVVMVPAINTFVAYASPVVFVFNCVISITFFSFFKIYKKAARERNENILIPIIDIAENRLTFPERDFSDTLCEALIIPGIVISLYFGSFGLFLVFVSELISEVFTNKLEKIWKNIKQIIDDYEVSEKNK